MIRERKVSSGKMRVQLRVSFAVPVGADRDDCQQYVLAAVKGWCGQFHPEENPLADLASDTVVVQRTVGRTALAQNIKVMR